MSFIVILFCLALLIVLISYFKVNAFLAFLLISILAGLGLGIPLENLPVSITKGIGSIMGSLTLIIVLGAMLGKLVAESGAARKIADVMVGAFGTKKHSMGFNDHRIYCGHPIILWYRFRIASSVDFLGSIPIQTTCGLYRIAHAGSIIGHPRISPPRIHRR